MNHRVMYRGPVSRTRPRPLSREASPIVESLSRTINALGTEQALRELQALIPHLIGLKDTLKTSVDAAQETIKKAQAIQKGDPGAPADEQKVLNRILTYVIPRIPKAIKPSDAELRDLIVPLIPPPVKGDKGDMPTVEMDAIVAEVLSEIREPKDGNDGKAPAIEDIVAAVAEHLITNKKLSIEHINGLAPRMKELQNRPGGYIHGGGITRLTAGSNITIVKLSDGSYRITAASSALAQLAATETPNGSRTVFTFAAASAQPNFVVVDNVPMRAINADLTVNWTWASGTKKATLNVPAPNSECYAIV